MGRKKKKVTEPSKQVQNETDLVYSGKVIVKLKIGDKVIQLSQHNAGTNILKMVFCKFLVNEDGVRNYVPQYVDLRYFDTNSGWITCLSKKASINERNYNNINPENQYRAFLSATIPHSTILRDFNREDMVGKQFRFYLCTGLVDGSYLDLAYLGVSREYLLQIVPGTSALIEWTMQLLNENEIRS